MKTGLSTGYLAAAGGVAATTAALAPFQARVNATTVALSLLVVVLLVAARWGSRPALAASALGILCFNFFFLPPVGALTIADPQNWAALVAFLVTALTAGQLSARARRRAEEADRLNRHVQALVELARIEAGEMRLRRRWTSVDELMAAAVERAAPLTRAHRLEVAAGGELPAVRVDAEAVAEPSTSRSATTSSRRQRTIKGRR